MTARFLAFPILELKNSWRRPLHLIMLVVFALLLAAALLAGGQAGGLAAMRAPISAKNGATSASAPAAA